MAEHRGYDFCYSIVNCSVRYFYVIKSNSLLEYFVYCIMKCFVITIFDSYHAQACSQITFEIWTRHLQPKSHALASILQSSAVI